jgi:hypothetical protein
MRKPETAKVHTYIAEMQLDPKRTCGPGYENEQSLTLHTGPK